LTTEPGSPVVTLLLHCCYTVVTLLLHCCYTVVTLWLHCGYTVVTIVSHCCTIGDGSAAPAHHARPHGEGEDHQEEAPGVVDVLLRV
jgi:hypothetical protein